MLFESFKKGAVFSKTAYRKTFRDVVSFYEAVLHQAYFSGIDVIIKSDSCMIFKNTV